MTRVDPAQARAALLQGGASAAAGSSSAAGCSYPPYASYAVDEAINSDDELGDSIAVDQATNAANEHEFERQLAQRGLELRRMAQDGNCLFRCVADRVYGDAEMHDVVRRLCLDHVEKERDHFSQYMTQDFDAYVLRKRRDRTFGNHLEIQAISEIYNRPVHVFDVNGDAAAPMNTYAASTEGDPGVPLRLSYHGRSHYNVLVDPTHADVGEGLGLPGLQPGLADRMQVEQAVDASETSALEAQLVSEAQSTSEMDMTQEAILQAAIRASLEDATGGTSAAPSCGGGLYDDAIATDDALALVDGLQLIMCVAPAVQWYPLYGELFEDRITDASKRTIQRILKDTNLTPCLIPGGFSEATYTGAQPDVEYSYIADRLGFIRMAIEAGVDIIPSYSYGLNDMYVTLEWQRHWRAVKAQALGLPTVLWTGPFLLGNVPFTENITVVTFDPFPTSQYTVDQTAKAHADYMDYLKRCFDSRKAECGAGHKRLEFIGKNQRPASRSKL